MDGAGEQFLAGAGLAQDQNGGIAGRNRLRLVQSLFQDRALANNFLEIESGVDLALQVTLFLGQFVLELSHFTMGAGIIESDGQLTGNLLQKTHILRRESSFLPAAQIQRANRPFPGHHWNAAKCPDTMFEQFADSLVMHAQKFFIAVDPGFHCQERTAGGGVLQRHGRAR
jgi:hypothetical protein